MKFEMYSPSLKISTMGNTCYESIHADDVTLSQACMKQYNMLKTSVRTQLIQIETNMGGTQPMLEALRKVIDHLTILFLIGNDHSIPFGIITNQHVLRVKGNKKLYLCPMYTFRHPLNENGIRTILQLYNEPVLAPHDPWRTSIINEMMSRNSDHPRYQLYQDPRFITASKSFEFIIRTIPGSYQNGDWRQLHGFFGMYYCLPHSDLSDCPSMAFDLPTEL